MFLKDARVGVLCYAIDNKKSLDDLQEWYEHLESKQSEMFIVIVGSKSDLSANRAVPAVFAQNLQRTIPNCKFVTETSAFEDQRSIHELFNQIGKEIVNGSYYKQSN